MATCLHSKLIQSCPTLYDAMQLGPPGSSVCLILQARILEWVAIPSSKRSSQHRVEPVSLKSHALAGRFFTMWLLTELENSMALLFYSWIPCSTSLNRSAEIHNSHITRPPLPSKEGKLKDNAACEFPGSAVVSTQHFHCSGPGSIPGAGED